MTQSAMADRRPLIRATCWAAAVLTVLLALYVGSFVLIKWTKPRVLLDQNHDPMRAYQIIYWPLRWLSADRPSFLSWWWPTTTVRGVVGEKPALPYPVGWIDLSIAGETHRVILRDTGPIDFAAVRTGQTYTVLITGVIAADERFTDVFLLCADRIDP